MTISELVHNYRIKHGLTVTELSKQTGIPQRTIGLIENGQTTVPHPATLKKLEKFLNRS